MKLLKLTLNNFQGIKSLEFDFDGGKSASIYGDNATGKTTVYNAITWLLFDKASTAAKNFTPKTKGPDGDLHNLEHSSEGVFEMDKRNRIGSIIIGTDGVADYANLTLNGETGNITLALDEYPNIIGQFATAVSATEV